MKSIQTKFLVLILCCVLLCSGIIGWAGVMRAQDVIDRESAKSMNLLCSEQAGELNGLLSRIEQSVETLYYYADGQMTDVERLKNDEQYLTQYTDKLESVAVNSAENTEGAIAVYVRYNPDEFPPTSGTFWSRNARKGVYREMTPTDLSMYQKDDVEHVGWYYEPVKNEKATWMQPYVNQNLEVKMISYVIPLMEADEIIGVVGMDIDFDVISKHVEGLTCYDTGYAVLVDEQGRIAYHQSLPSEVSMKEVDPTLMPVARALEAGSSEDTMFTYNWGGETKRMVFRSLSNGMRLAVTVPVSEIDAAKNKLIVQIMVSVLIIACFAAIVTILMVRRIIRPLKELTEAAQKIAEGDLSITIQNQSKDEIGVLARSFQQTVKHLQSYISYINSLAYRDSLTGMRNKTAYEDALKHLEEEMKIGKPTFGVIVLDINDLKVVNDTYGHDYGDILIKDSCALMSKIFKHSPVYRIGGDEFVIILQNADYENYQKLLDCFDIAVENHNKESRTGVYISVALGVAEFDPVTDIIFNDVFKRADNAMYVNKAFMKAKNAREAEEKRKEKKETLE